MKSILWGCLVFLMSVSPVLGALTPEDLDKIRLIVKAEIAESEVRLRSEIAASEMRLRSDIDKSERQLKTYVDTKFESVDTKFESIDKRLTLVVGFVSALIILIVVTVGIPQIIIAWRGKNEQTQDKKIEELAQEIERLKERWIVKP